MIRVMLVDDHALVRMGFRMLLANHHPQVEVVAEADTGEQACADYARARPDVVVMDLSMPGMGGIAATRRIREVCPDVQVLVLTWYADAERVRLAFAAGATGYVLKGDPHVDLLDSIREVALRRRCVSAAVSQF